MSKSTKNPKTADMESRSGYVSVNGLNMYYEIHGMSQPLVLLHGAFSGIGTSFGRILPGLARRARSLRLSCRGTLAPRTLTAR